MLKKPQQAPSNFRQGKDRIQDCPDGKTLENAAVRVRYESSDYHCIRKDGRFARRAKPASHCQTEWSIDQAQIVLREAIRKGNVSERWEGQFPRKAWAIAGGVCYEACGKNGVFHAYPIEEINLPEGLSNVHF